MAADVYVADCLRDLGHVTGNAFVARAARTVMRVLLDAGGMRPVLRVGAVARQAERIALLAHNAGLSVPCGSWQLKQVTPRAYIRLWTKSFPCMRFLCAVPSAKCVKVVSPSLCSSSLPEVRQVQADMKADRPVVIFSLDRICQRSAL